MPRVLRQRKSRTLEKSPTHHIVLETGRAITSGSRAHARSAPTTTTNENFMMRIQFSKITSTTPRHPSMSSSECGQSVSGSWERPARLMRRSNRSEFRLSARLGCGIREASDRRVDLPLRSATKKNRTASSGSGFFREPAGPDAVGLLTREQSKKPAARFSCPCLSLPGFGASG